MRTALRGPARLRRCRHPRGRRIASPRATGGGGTCTVPIGMPIATAISVRGIPRKKCWTTIARHSGSSRRSASSSCSRSATPADSSPTDGIRIGVSSTSIDRRRRRLATSMQALHGQAAEPGVEPVRVAQPGQVPPGSHHGVLDGVSRELAVPEDQAGGPVQPRDGRARKHREGVLVASLRPHDEVSLVHGRSAPWRGSPGRARMLLALTVPERFPATRNRAHPDRLVRRPDRTFGPQTAPDRTASVRTRPNPPLAQEPSEPHDRPAARLALRARRGAGPHHHAPDPRGLRPPQGVPDARRDGRGRARREPAGDGRRVHRAHGPVGIRQEHAAAAPRRPRPTHVRRGASSMASPSAACPTTRRRACAASERASCSSRSTWSRS